MNICLKIALLVAVLSESATAAIHQDWYYDSVRHLNWTYTYSDATPNEASVGGYVPSGNGYSWSGNLTHEEGPITIPSSFDGKVVTAIGKWGFKNAYKITSISMPSTIKSIGDEAFLGCGALSSLYVGAGVVRISSSAFSGCTNLRNIYISDLGAWCGISRSSFPSSCHYYLNGKLLEEIMLPSVVTSIAACAFQNFSSVTNVVFPIGLKDIGAYAFSGCTKLSDIDLPESIESVSPSAFLDVPVTNVSLRLITPLKSMFPSSYGLLRHVTLKGDSHEIPAEAFSGCASMPEINLPESTATIGDLAFSGCAELTEIQIPVNVSRIGADAFTECGNLEKVAISDLAAWCGIDFANYRANPLSNGGGLYLNDYKVSTLTIPSEIKKVGSYAFAGCSSITSIDIRDGVECIGRGAFAGCVNLQQVSLAGTLQSLGSLDLRNVNVQGAYDSSGFKIWNGWILGYADESVSQIVIPEGIIGIAPFAFADFWDLEEVVLPESLKYIGYGAFMNDTYLDNVVIPDGVEYIDDEAFSGCTYLRDIVIGAGVNEVGNGAFRNCTQITTLTMPDGIESIGDGVFSNCWRMLSVKLPLGLSKIGTGMFEKCSSLVGASVPSDTFTMNELFGDRSSKLVSVSIIEGSTQICTNAFSGCSALESVEIPQGITNIQSGAFKNCVKLSDVSLPETVDHLGAQAFYGCTVLAGIVLPDSVEVIDAEVFRNCSSLRNVTLSRNLRSLPDYAFYGCRSLVSMVVSASVANIGSYISNYLTALYFLGNAPGYSPNAYSSTPSSMKTYVVQGSRGWDGIPSSRDMPETWIGRAITYWTPNRFNAIFDSNGGSFHNEALTYACEQITDTSYAIPPFEPTRIGYAFAGWWTDRTDGAQIKATTRVNETRETTFYAHWKLMYTPVTVRFNANGGVVVPDEAEYFAGLTYGDFPVPTKEHYQFVGWFTAPDGGNVVAVSDEVPSAGAELYAHWTPETYHIRYNANGGYGTMADQSFKYGDNIVLRANTFSKANSNFIGWGVEPEGPVVYPDKKQISTLGAVQGGVINLYAQWSAAKYAVRYDSNGGVGTMDSDTFTVDVGQPLSRNLFTRQGYIFIGWSKSADATAAEYEDCEVVKNLTGNTNAAVALFAVWARNTSNVSISCEGDAPWHPAKFTRNGEVVWQSGVIGDGETTVAQSLIAGRGTLSFDWSASCEESFRGMRLDYLVFIVDGTEVGFVNGNTDWDAVSCTIDSDGEHVIEWRYVKDSAGAAYDDCGRVTSVCWTPSLNTLSDFANAVGLSLVSDSESKWFGETAVSYDGISAIQSGPISDGECSSVECTVWGQGQLSFWWKVSCEEPFRGLPLDYASFAVDEIEQCWIAGNADWTNVVVVLEGAGQHKLTWTYRKDAWANTSAGLDCAWLDAVTWTPSGAAEGLAVEVDGAAVEFETAADGKTRTAEVAAGTAAADIKILVGGVDVTAGFNVSVVGMTAMVVLKEPYETARSASAPYQENEDGTTVTLNVEVVPGLYYAADSAATLEALKRPSATEPAKAGDAVVAPKQEGAQGFYKVWVSDAPIKAE